MKKFRKMSDKKLLKAYANLSFRSMTYGRCSEELSNCKKEVGRRNLI